MDFIKNAVLVLCCLFLVGCLKVQSEEQNLNNFDLTKITIDQKTHPVVILGGGIAGLTASIYMSQANITPLVLQGPTPGGSITKSDSVRNWPAEMNISGKDLTDKIYNQAIQSGAKINKEIATDVDFSVWPYIIKTKNLESGETDTIKALSCIIAIGTKPIELEVPGEKEYFGKGLSTCAICDGPLYNGKEIAIVGGGYKAMTEANYLSNIAKKVYIIVRKDKLRASGKLIDRIISKSNVEVLYNTTVKNIKGNGKKLSDITIFDQKLNTEKNLKLDGLFLAIGSIPNTQLFKDQIELDSFNYIETKKYQETSKSGIFAAGDICNPEYKQAINAAGEGALAALSAIHFLEETGFDAKKIDNQKTTPTIPSSEKVVKEKPTKQKTTTVVEIKSTKKFEELIAKTETPIVVDFYSTWCIPCQKMMPIINDLAKHFGEKIKFVKINVSQNQEIASMFDIQSIPTFVLMQKGKEIKRIVGGRDFENFKKMIDENLIR